MEGSEGDPPGARTPQQNLKKEIYFRKLKIPKISYSHGLEGKAIDKNLKKEEDLWYRGSGFDFEEFSQLIFKL